MLKRKKIISLMVALVIAVTFSFGNVSRAQQPEENVLCDTEAPAEASEAVTEQGTEEPYTEASTEYVPEAVTEQETEEACTEASTEQVITEAPEEASTEETGNAADTVLPAEKEMQPEEAEASQTDAEPSGEIVTLVERTGVMVYATSYQVLTHQNISNDSGASCGYFTISGVSGYAVCGDQNITGPAAGTYANDVQSYDGQVYRDIFYYGYGGPGAGELDFNSNKGNAIVALSKTISYYSLGDAGLSGSSGGSGMHHEAKILYDYAVSDAHNAPSTSLTFSKTGSINVSVSGSIQKTETITLNGDSRMSYDIPLQAGMSLYKSDGTLVASGSAARVYGGTAFYITAPLSKNGEWSTGTLYSNEQTIGSVTRLDFGSSAQPVWFANPVKASSSFSVTFKAPCAVELIKASANPAVTDGNSCYSLENAIYGIYASRADAQADAVNADGSLPGNSKRIAIIKTNADGYGKAENLACPSGGIFYLKELVPPKGYALDLKVYTVNVVSGETAKVEKPEPPQLDPAAILVEKKGSKGVPLADAEFTVRFYKDVQKDTDPALEGMVAERTWVLKTLSNGGASLDDECKVSGDDFYYLTTGDTGLPLGTVTIQETKAPEGYYIDDTVYVRQVTSSGYLEQVNTYNAPVVTDEFIPGKIVINKTAEVKEWNEETKEFDLSTAPMKEATFGIYAAEDIYVNGSDTEIAYPKDSTVDTVTTNASGRAVSIDLYAGKYVVREINTPPEYKAADDVEVTISVSDSISIVETEGGQTEGYIKTINMLNKLTEIKLGTIATDSATGTNQGCISDKCSITDRTKISGLVPGREYVLCGMAVDKETGEQLNVSGVPVASGKTFTAAAEYEEKDVTYTFNSLELKGHDIVFYEYLYYEGELVALHADIGDEGQTIHFPEIGTSATDSATGTRQGTVSEKCTLTDTVTYKNLLPEKEYTLKTVVTYKESGEPVIIEGKELTAEKTFTAETATGQIDVTVTFDASELAGKDIVFYEYLYYEGELVALHADIGDEGQTIHFPEIGTSATDSATGTRQGTVSEKCTLTDTVTYKNLLPEKEYTLKTVVTYKGSGEPVVINGEKLTAEKTFTAETAAGQIDVTVTFDASELAGKDIVFFEYLYHEGVLVEMHADIEDEGQTISYPPEAPPTGDGVPIAFLILSALGALIGMILLYRRRLPEK